MHAVTVIFLPVCLHLTAAAEAKMQRKKINSLKKASFSPLSLAVVVLYLQAVGTKEWREVSGRNLYL